MKIIKNELEIEELHKGKVKPIGTGGHIPFLKKFIGRIVGIVIPKERMVFWIFGRKEIDLLKKEIKNIKFVNLYRKQRKEEVINAVNNLNKEEFEIDNLLIIINRFKNSEDKRVQKLIRMIKKNYSI